MYKDNLALNNLQGLICYKTKLNQIIYIMIYIYIYIYICVCVCVCVCLCVCVCVCIKKFW